MLTRQPGKNESRTLALLGGLCFFLTVFEYLIPKPLPFMRIGLANLPLLLALDILTTKNFFLLALIKVLGQGIVGGTLFSYVFLFSIAGTFSSASVMYILRALSRKKQTGFTGLGCAGAMASNTVQLVLARYLVFGPAIRYLIPPFLAAGFITGTVLGLACEFFCKRSKWYTAQTAGGNTPAVQRNAENQYTLPPEKTVLQSKKETVRPGRYEKWNRFFNADELFVTGLIMILLFLFCRSMPGRIIQFVFFSLIAFISGKKINLLSTLPVMAGIVFFNLLVPYGKIIAVFGPLLITQGSLVSGIEKAVTLQGLATLSAAFIKSNLKLPGGIGALLGKSLRILEELRERSGIAGQSGTRESVIEKLDRTMLELESAETEDLNIQPGKTGRSVKKILLLSGMVIITAAAGVIPRLYI